MKYILLVFTVLFISSSLWAKDIRIGIYQNPPKVYIDAKGQPAGFIYDIINHIASEEKWNPVYIPCTWEECLHKLSQGDLDIMPDVTWSAERQLIYDFNSVPVIESWLQIFTKQNNKIENLHDLNNKKIAVLRGSVQHFHFSAEASQKYGIKYSLMDYADYPSTVNSIRSGESDLLVADRFFYYSSERGSDIIPTPVIFAPSNIFFAFTKEKDHKLITAVDRELSAMKNDPDSVYYSFLQNGLSSVKLEAVPLYIRKIMFSAFAAVIFLAFLTIFLRSKIRKKTAELSSRNSELEAIKEKLERSLAETENRGIALSATLEEKENLIRELFHRTGNNMQVICSILTIQGERGSDPEFRSAFNDAANRVRSMALVQDMLYQKGNLSRIDLDKYIRELSFHLRENYGIDPDQVSINFDLEPISILIDYATPCGLVLNELLNNSFKHAFNNTEGIGNIFISLRLTQNAELHIHYSDSGSGPDLQQPGINSGSFGLTLIKGIVENQLKGKVVFTGSPEPFTCDITFSESGYKERI